VLVSSLSSDNSGPAECSSPLDEKPNDGTSKPLLEEVKPVLSEPLKPFWCPSTIRAVEQPSNEPDELGFGCCDDVIHD